MDNKKYASMKGKRRVNLFFCYLVLILISIIWLYPFFGIVMQSFRSYSSEYGGMVSYLIPKHFSLDNYKFLLSGKTNYVSWYVNTVIIALFTALLIPGHGMNGVYIFRSFTDRQRMYRAGFVFNLTGRRKRRSMAICICT